MSKYNFILQIDDDTDDCDLFESVLRQVSQAKYLAINNPLVALEKLFKGMIRPDVTILDVNMPGIDGMEVLTKIKDNADTSEIPVIMFSTSSYSGLKKKLVTLGAVKYITKPNSIQDLQKIILTEML